MRRFALLLALVTLGGCSLVNDPGRHRGAEGELDGGVDGGDGSVDGGDGSVDGGDGGSDAGPPSIPMDDFCPELAELGCRARENCCEMEDLPPVDECIETVIAACERELAPTFMDSRTGYSPERAAQVIADGYELQDSCSTDIAEWYVFEVLSVMRGTSMRGINCAPPGGSFQEDPAAFWQCDADMDLVCRPNSGGGWECQGVSSAGGPCNIIYHCRRGLYCTSFALGRCEQQLGRGEPCTDGSQCESFVCSEAGMCERLDQSVYCIPVEDFYTDESTG